MTNPTRWSQKPDWETGESATGRHNIEKLLRELQWLLDLLKNAHRALGGAEKYEQNESWWSLTEEWAGPSDGRIAFGGKDFYKGGTLHRDLHQALTQLTEEGYDVRQHWREVRDMFAQMWEILPDMYKVAPDYIGDLTPADYDPAKPFPQYPIPEDIDE